MNSPDTIVRLNAALSGRYEVERGIGEGGMATVYLAKDLKHNRSVALKVLKPELAAVVGAERFLAEIETTANLQHPHILPLFDSGEADSFLFYVMPYVEGETLRERIDRDKQLPVEEAVAIASAVAKALQHAHDRGVIHRDIKPGNILMQDGQPVVSDFGIALAVGSAGGARLTETGLSLGTPFYMSPEQATGDQVVGPGTDIYAIGAVLYEMLVGDPPYMGSTAQAVLGKIIQGEPVSATVARRSVPAHVDAAIRNALEKLPADRFSNAQDFVRALGDSSFAHRTPSTVQGDGVPASWRAVAVGFAVTTTALVLALAMGRFRTVDVESHGTSFFEVAFDTGEGFVPGTLGPEFDLTSDGRTIVYVGPGNGGGTQLWKRELGDLTPVPIPGTQNARGPAISPDGGAVVFVTQGGFSTVSLTGAPPRRLIENVQGVPRWGMDDFIYFRDDRGLGRVPPSGGAAESVVPAPASGGYWYSATLPGGRTILATHNTGTPRNSRIHAISLETGETNDLVSGVLGLYSESGHLVYVASDGTLLAAPFDADEARLTGEPTALLQGIEVKGAANAMFAIAGDGSLLYRTGASTSGLYNLVWVDRDGTVERVDANWPPFDGSSPGSGGADEIAVELSPDGTRAALKIFTDAGEDIWIKQLDDGPLSRLTFDEGLDRRPRWTPDGEYVVFHSERGGNRDLWRRRADGTGVPELILDLERPIIEVQLSPDGEWFVLRLGGVGAVVGDRDLVGMTDRDAAMIPLAAESYDEKAAALSPDGRWLAYESTETGTDEIYVRPFPVVDEGKWQVSVDGGVAPRWSRSGDELYYVSNSVMMAALVQGEAGGFRVAGRIPLFSVADRAITAGANWAPYDVAADGRFLMHQNDITAQADRRFVLAIDFDERLRRLIPN